MENRRSNYFDVIDVCYLKYRTHSPTKAQKNTVTQMFRDGKFGKAAFKIGREWFVDMDAYSKGEA